MKLTLLKKFFILKKANRWISWFEFLYFVQIIQIYVRPPAGLFSILPPV